MAKFLTTLTLAVFILGSCALGQAEERNDKRIDQDGVPVSIKVEPEYESGKPLYALAVFGEKSERAIWMVLDKSNVENESYDRLYVDLNSNGVLTEKMSSSVL